MSAERLHSILRTMGDDDWAALKALMAECFSYPAKEADIELLERLFRRGEALARQAGGAVLRAVQAIIGNPVLMTVMRKARERARERVRFLMQEMADDDWQRLKGALEEHLPQTGDPDEIAVLELVFRIGESVTNIETAAQALADKLSGRKLLAPEVARRNALIKPLAPGTAKLDPEAAYLAAQAALTRAEETARRAQNTLAAGYVRATPPYRHARNTVFKLVDAILESPALMAEAARVGSALAAAPPVSREQMRWALHRMPASERMEVINLIPLNTILMVQERNGQVKAAEQHPMATRDRRLACDLFVHGQSDEELSAAYGCSVNGIKNAVGEVLQALTARPRARQRVSAFLEHMARVAPMSIAEVRNRMKQLPSETRAEILSEIPNSAWKARNMIHLHKHLFLDYLSGEWVLSRLVDYYNLEKAGRLAGVFKTAGRLSVRGANAAIEGLLHKIAGEPGLRAKLLLNGV